MNTKHQISVEAIAFEIGQRAADRAAEDAKELCFWNRQVTEAAVEPEQVVILARVELLKRKAEQIRSFLGQFRLEGGGHSRTYYVVVLSILLAASLALAYATFAPFGFGIATWPVSLGAAVLAMLAIDRVLTHFDSRRFIGILCIAAFVATFAALLVAAVLRGEVFEFYLKTAGALGAGAGVDDALDFYRHAGPFLKVTFAMLTLALELTIGLVLNDARKRLPVAGELDAACKQLASIEEEILQNLRAHEENRNKARLDEAKTMQAFCAGLLSRARSASRSVVLLALLAFALHGQTAAVGLDLSQSMAKKGFGSGSDYERSVDAFAESIEALPPGAQVTVLGITGQSFSRPSVLLSGQLPYDKGPLEFLDRVELARKKMQADVRRLSRTVRADAQQTDIFGFLIFAAQFLQRQAQPKKVLIVYSDMRNSVPGIDFEKQEAIDVPATFRAIERQQLLADLHGIDVHILGVHAAGKSVRYWNSLRNFWSAYFRRAGGNLKTFSMTTEARPIWQKQ